LESDTKSASTSYIDSNVEIDSEYIYRVSAINSVGTSAASSEASATPKVTLDLSPLGKFNIDEKRRLTFTAKITDSSIKNVSFSLAQNPPTGAKISSNTGVFTWTPTDSQGGKSYTFDVTAKKDSMTDRQSITITVNDVKSEPVKEPEPTEPEPITEPKDLGLASFVEKTKDPQSYVDRYNAEASYKKWFDDNYPDITIYQAVGLEEPVEPEDPEPQIGLCGTGTELVNGKCELVKQPGGGCLIATATYGSEMAPQVQFLREIRDGKVMSTESGISFMTGFNQMYYSFSPYIADYERENPVFKEMVKVGITPLLSSLSVMSLADSEEEILGYGIGVILMNLGMYVAAPAMLIYGARKFIRV